MQTTIEQAKNKIIGKQGTERRDNYEREKVKQLFNWGEISRIFSGTRSVIQRNSIPNIHKPIINEMLQAVDDVLKKHGVTK